ncbi:unnamed protein product [Cochlearia groenlandica]
MYLFFYDILMISMNTLWFKAAFTRQSKTDKEHGYSKWSKVASRLLGRTDNQCLNPRLASLKQEAARLRRETTIGNFVDRESERPEFSVTDVLALAEISCEPDSVMEKKRKKKAYTECEREASIGDDIERQPKRRRQKLDNVKEKKQRRKPESIEETSSISSVIINFCQVKTGISKLKPRRKVYVVGPIGNQDAPN